MSTSDSLFLSPGIPVEQAREQLIDALGLEHRIEGPDHYLWRTTPSETVTAVGGLFEPNVFGGGEWSDPNDFSVLDGYPISWDLRIRPANGPLPVTARALFNDVIRALPEWPVLLVRQLDLLLAAYAPGPGVVDFPSGTELDGEARRLWKRFDLASRPDSLT